MSFSLNNAFESKSDEFETWTPKNAGDNVLGQITQLGISRDYGTPFVVLQTENETPLSVFVKMGLLGHFQRVSYLTAPAENERNFKPEWTEKAKNELINQYIAFQYLGTERNAKTNRDFQKYKVLWQSELIEAGFKPENAPAQTPAETPAVSQKTTKAKLTVKKPALTPKPAEKVRKGFPTDENVCEYIMHVWEQNGLEKHLETEMLRDAVNKLIEAETEFNFMSKAQFSKLLKALIDNGQLYEPKPDVLALLLD